MNITLVGNSNNQPQKSFLGLAPGKNLLSTALSCCARVERRELSGQMKQEDELHRCGTLNPFRVIDAMQALVTLSSLVPLFHRLEANPCHDNHQSFSIMHNLKHSSETSILKVHLGRWDTPSKPFDHHDS